MEKEKNYIKEDEVFQILRRAQQMTIEDLCNKLFCSDYLIRKHLKSLREDNKVKMWKLDKTAFFSVFPEHRCEEGHIATSRTYEFRPLGIYNLRAFMDRCEYSRNSDKGMV